MKNKVLLFGASGKLGSEIKKQFPSEYELFYPTHKECDITNISDVCSTFNNVKPDLVIHTAALVGMLECEKNKDIAWKTNVMGTVNIAKCCSKYKSRLIFTSTCIVFDGKKGYYTETDTPTPTNYYAISKLAAEQAVSLLNTSVIIRFDFFPLDKLKYENIFIDHYTSKIPVTEAATKIITLCNSDFNGLINIGRERESLYKILKPYFPDIKPIKISDSSVSDYPKDISLDLSKWNNLHFK